MALRVQPWNARVGSQMTEARHPMTERLRNSRSVGQDEILNPSFAVRDPQATVLAEYTANGAPRWPSANTPAAGSRSFSATRT